MFAWDDLRLVLAVERSGNLAAAAAALGINHSTMFRRLTALETGEIEKVVDDPGEAARLAAHDLRLPSHLAGVWAMPSSAAWRRRVLFDIWDQSAESDDPERAWGGARARRLIDSFVRRNLPPGSDEGFEPDELARLNRARIGHAQFDPYAPPARASVVRRDASR